MTKCHIISLYMISTKYDSQNGEKYIAKKND